MSWITLVPDTIKFFKFKVIHLIRPQPEDKSLRQDKSHKNISYTILSNVSVRQIPIEQNRCAMACQGCGAVLFLLKSSGITFHNPLLLSYHTKQLN